MTLLARKNPPVVSRNAAITAAQCLRDHMKSPANASGAISTPGFEYVATPTSTRRDDVRPRTGDSRTTFVVPATDLYSHRKYAKSTSEKLKISDVRNTPNTGTTDATTNATPRIAPGHLPMRA